MQPLVYIEFGRNVKNREELKGFEKYCNTEPTLRRCFRGVEGRKFFFRFPTQKDSQEFLQDAKNMMERNGMITELQYEAH